LVQLRDQKHLRVRRHGAACDDAWPQVYGRSADERRAQGHDLEIVIQMLPQAAAERSAGHTWMALAVMADAPQVAPRRVGKKDVRPQVDGLRRALEASPEAGKRSKVHGGVDGDEHVGILRDGLVGRERAQQGDAENAGRGPRRPHEQRSSRSGTATTTVG
jgi:hypothetical protein